MKKESGNQKFNIKFDIAVNIVMGIIYINWKLFYYDIKSI